MVLQALLNGLIDASVIVLAAMGLSLIYGVKRFANFAHGDMMTVGAYVALTVLTASRGDIVLALIVSVLVLAGFGVLFEFAIFERLEGRGPISPLIASVGLAIVLQNAIRVIWGSEIQTYSIVVPDNWLFDVRDPFSGFRLFLNPLQGFVPLVMGAVLVLLVTFLLKYTKLGKAMRATADNPELARVSGINVRVVRYATWALAGGLAASGGVMLGVRLNGIVPLLGFNVLLLVFAAVILGGIGSAYGAMFGALVMSIAQDLFFPIALQLQVPEQFALLIPFGIMLIVLLIRPQGIAGRAIGFDVPPLRAEFRKLFQSLARWTRR